MDNFGLLMSAGEVTVDLDGVHEYQIHNYNVISIVDGGELNPSSLTRRRMFLGPMSEFFLFLFKLFRIWDFLL